MIVCKFGGTSLADAENIKKVTSIIKSDPNRSMVVVSAPGKRFEDDIKVTDLLYNLAKNKSEKDKFEQILHEIKSRFVQMIKELGVEGKAVLNSLEIIAEEILQGVSQDFVASRGEYLNALLISEYMGFKFVDSTEFVRLYDDGSINPETYELGKKVLDRSVPTIVPGFYGLDSGGHIKTFSRGGSDISGAILAVCVDADLYQNWTDVSGVLAADPRIAKSPALVPEITYAELRQLACFGANVFHSAAIAPVANAGIPIQIKNTLIPDAEGTTISCERQVDKMPIVGVSGMQNLKKIWINKENLNHEDLSEIVGELNLLGFNSFYSRLATDYAYVYGTCAEKDFPSYFDLNLCEDEFSAIGIVGQGLSWSKVLSMINALESIEVIDVSFEDLSSTVIVVVKNSDYQKSLQILASQIS